MQPQEIVINLDNGFDMLAVWEKNGKRWHLLELARPQKAVMLGREDPTKRLVFPPGISPNKLAKYTCYLKSKKSQINCHSINTNRKKN